MNVFEKLIDIMIGICIMLLFPVLYFNKKSDLIVYEALKDRLNEFVQEVSTQGKLTQTNYEQFYDVLNKFDLALKIELQYEEYRYEPKYKMEDALTTPKYTGEIFEYLNVVPNDEIIGAVYEKGGFFMNSGGYFRVSITVVKDNRTIYSGGAVRANLSLCDHFCNHCNYLCYNT
ncbi:MAG: hypothetical protein PUC65_16020 [Clostridiales bacterium]|nr:hypothetical protein [Clostridiales bacterium]